MVTFIPVVATDAGSIPEVIDDGHDGVLVPQHDSHALTVAIADLINDFERRVRLGNNAARKVRTKFDVTVCEHIFHNRLSKVLSSKQKISELCYIQESPREVTGSNCLGKFVDKLSPQQLIIPKEENYDQTSISSF